MSSTIRKSVASALVFTGLIGGVAYFVSRPPTSDTEPDDDVTKRPIASAPKLPPAFEEPRVPPPPPPPAPAAPPPPTPAAPPPAPTPAAPAPSSAAPQEQPASAVAPIAGAQPAASARPKSVATTLRPAGASGAIVRFEDDAAFVQAISTGRVWVYACSPTDRMFLVTMKSEAIASESCSLDERVQKELRSLARPSAAALATLGVDGTGMRWFIKLSDQLARDVDAAVAGERSSRSPVVSIDVSGNVRVLDRGPRQGQTQSG